MDKLKYYQMTDEELMVSNISYEIKFKILYDRYYKRIKNYIRKYVRNETDVEDLTQTTFSRLYIFRDNYSVKPGVSFQTYLHTVARSVVFTFFRSKKRGGNIIMGKDCFRNSDGELIGIENFVDPGSYNVEEDLEMEKIFEIIEEVKAEKPEFVEVLEDFLYDHKAPRRSVLQYISEKHNIPIGTVKSRMHRARQRIKEKVVEKGLVLNM